MFAPTREQARQFFFDTWEKYREGRPLQGLEGTALEILLMHPEYHSLLDQPSRFLDREYGPESGVLNPFLHLSLHLAVSEQLALDQLRGIRRLHDVLLARGDVHTALHAMLECLAEVVWEANRSRTAPDETAYIDCVRRRVDSHE